MLMFPQTLCYANICVKQVNRDIPVFHPNWEKVLSILSNFALLWSSMVKHWDAQVDLKLIIHCIPECSVFFFRLIGL